MNTSATQIDKEELGIAVAQYFNRLLEAPVVPRDILDLRKGLSVVLANQGYSPIESTRLANEIFPLIMTRGSDRGQSKREEKSREAFLVNPDQFRPDKDPRFYERTYEILGIPTEGLEGSVDQT